MATEGISGLFIETHNWGKSVAFWQQLGYQLEFETDHHSGQLRHPGGGAWIFLAERPGDRALEFYPVLQVDDSAAFEAPAAGSVEQPFVAQPGTWSNSCSAIRTRGESASRPRSRKA